MNRNSSSAQTNCRNHPPILTMLAMYGEIANKQCKSCTHLYHRGPRAYGKKRYYKCNLNKDTAGPATDWRTSWPACGKFEEKT